MARIIKKKTRKKESEEELDVQETLAEIKDTIKERQQNIVKYGAIAAAVILAAGGAFLYNKTTSEEAARLEYEGYKAYYNEYVKQPVQGTEHFQKALDLFKQSYAKKKKAGTLLYAASSNLELGKYDDAINELNDLIKNHPAEKDIIPLAYQKLVSAQLKKGNRDEALKTLETVYKSDTGLMKDFALAESARLLEEDGRKEESEAKYKELADKFKDSPYADEAKKKLEKKQG